jgi:hypothetical protein
MDEKQHNGYHIEILKLDSEWKFEDYIWEVENTFIHCATY